MGIIFKVFIETVTILFMFYVLGPRHVGSQLPALEGKVLTTGPLGPSNSRIWSLEPRETAAPCLGSTFLHYTQPVNYRQGEGLGEYRSHLLRLSVLRISALLSGCSVSSDSHFVHFVQIPQRFFGRKVKSNASHLVILSTGHQWKF